MKLEVWNSSIYYSCQNFKVKGSGVIKLVNIIKSTNYNKVLMMERSFAIKSIFKLKSYLIGFFWNFVSLLPLLYFTLFLCSSTNWFVDIWRYLRSFNSLISFYFVLFYFALFCFSDSWEGCYLGLAGWNVFLIFSWTKIVKANNVAMITLLYENMLAAVGISEFPLKLWPYKGHVSQPHIFQNFHGKFWKE